MLIKECIYLIVIYLGLLSLVLLNRAIKNDNKYVSKHIVLLSIASIVCGFVDLCMLEVFYIPVKMEVYKVRKEVTFFSVILILILVLAFSATVLRDTYRVHKSDLVVVFESDGNGTIGGGDTFAYAIGEDFCKQFDLGIDIGGARLREYFPKHAIEIKVMEDLETNTGYRIEIREDEIGLVYKDGKQIGTINEKSEYFNIEFEKGFCIP